MNNWLQSRLFQCRRCEVQYTHDRARTHDLYVCPFRPRLTMKSRPYPVGAVEINRRNPALCGGFS